MEHCDSNKQVLSPGEPSSNKVSEESESGGDHPGALSSDLDRCARDVKAQIEALKREFAFCSIETSTGPHFARTEWLQFDEEQLTTKCFLPLQTSPDIYAFKDQFSASQLSTDKQWQFHILMQPPKSTECYVGELNKCDFHR